MNEHDRERLRLLLAEPGDPYLIPGTDCLKNKLGATDVFSLHDKEADHVFVRLVDLGKNPPSGDLSDVHLRAIHRAIFKGVYDWAGKYREIDISKDGYHFAPSHTIARSLRRVCLRHVLDLRNSRNDRPVFIRHLARFFNDVNSVHPFREGNGRTQEFYLSVVVERVGRSLDWSRFTQDDIDDAAIAGANGDIEPLHRLFSLALH